MILKLFAGNKTKQEDEMLMNDVRMYHFEGINLVFMKNISGDKEK